MSLTRVPLRWVGGKQRLSGRLGALLSSKLGEGTTYFEPFLGAGSIFFRLEPARSVLGDLNADLVAFYSFLRDAPVELRCEAERIDCDGRVETYLVARDEFNNGATGLRRAALFLYLNRTGFNGIWRVNGRGAYTVPFGYRRLSLVPDVEWRGASAALQGASIESADYSATLNGANTGDVVFLDPPYFDSSERELFSRYTLAGFDWRDHERLYQEVSRLTSLRVSVLLTLRSDPLLYDLYRDFKLDYTLINNSVSARGPHRVVGDLIVRNFE